MTNTAEKIPPAVGVYLGSSIGNNRSFTQAIIALGKGLAEHGCTLVYGGGGTGLMGILAETVKSQGGTVIGITTEHLAKIETPCDFLDELHVVHSMYERKRLIHEKSSQFLAMPGGIGTFDELFETWCAIKIGVINKPFGLINIDGYFNRMIEFVSECAHSGLLKEQDTKIPAIYHDVSSYLNDLNAAQQYPLLKSYSPLNPAQTNDYEEHLTETLNTD